MVAIKEIDNYGLEWLKIQPIAHRGFFDNDKKIPENSIRAFERAIELGYAIELDVHVTADMEVVVFHDDNLKELCGINIQTRKVTETEIEKYRLPNNEKIPLLREVLDFVNARVPILIEIKHKKGHKHANIIILNTILGYTGKVAIQSFSPLIVRWFAKNAPLIPRGQLSTSLKNNAEVPFLKGTLSKWSLSIFWAIHIS